MWIRNTEETEAIHIEGIRKETVLDGFIYPFKAICKLLGDGKILNQINNKNLSSTEITTRKIYKKAS
jgi:hypothetical protein